MKTHLSRSVVVSVVACLLALMGLLSTALPAAATTSSNEPDIAKIDAFVSSEMQAHRLPGVALGLVHNEQIMHLCGFGEADSSGRAVTPQTPFILASVSKSFSKAKVPC